MALTLMIRRTLVLGALLAVFFFVFSYIGQVVYAQAIPAFTQCADLIDNDEDGLIDFVPVVGDPDCDSIFDDSEGPSVPPPTDICTNEETDPGVQTEGPCNADDLCPLDTGVQTTTPCESDDVCPNDTGIQTEAPCASDDTCPNDEGMQTTTPCPSENTGGGSPSGDNTGDGGGSGAPTPPTGGGGGGGGSNGPVSGPSAPGFTATGGGGSGGLILGTSTEAIPTITLCGDEVPYLTTFMRMGQNNDAREVKKLQTFLNLHLGLSLPVSGYFGLLTQDAVNAFQLKHADDVLLPWVAHGLENASTSTGYVYKTTQRMINALACEIPVPMPQLP